MPLAVSLVRTVAVASTLVSGVLVLLVECRLPLRSGVSVFLQWLLFYPSVVRFGVRFIVVAVFVLGTVGVLLVAPSRRGLSGIFVVVHGSCSLSEFAGLLPECSARTTTPAGANAGENGGIVHSTSVA
ncbi:hypothetical protein [Halobacterium sp. CBA1126]|uniref:hypothetical protein n=1 Tax=Halobacterium sp. CBA1126 TaxID=2668074 RepID=UPI0018D1FFEC|nr:hypothetical protein [Halobacterium sp. CBA1126]